MRTSADSGTVVRSDIRIEAIRPYQDCKTEHDRRRSAKQTIRNLVLSLALVGGALWGVAAPLAQAQDECHYYYVCVWGDGGQVCSYIIICI